MRIGIIGLQPRISRLALDCACETVISKAPRGRLADAVSEGTAR